MIQHQIGFGKVFQDRRYVPTGHVGCYSLDLCLGPLKTPPEALKSIFAFSLAYMDYPSGLKIEDNGYKLTFLAEINLVNGDMADFLNVEPSVFST